MASSSSSSSSAPSAPSCAASSVSDSSPRAELFESLTIRLLRARRGLVHAEKGVCIGVYAGVCVGMRLPVYVSVCGGSEHKGMLSIYNYLGASTIDS